MAQDAVNDAVARDVLDDTALLDDLELIEAVRIVVEMPVHILIRLAEDLLIRAKAVELQKGIRRAEEAALAVLPEITELRMVHEALPEQGVKRRMMRLMAAGRGDRRVDALGRRQQERRLFFPPVVEQDDDAFLPDIIALFVTHAEAVLQSPVGALLDALYDRIGIEEGQIALLVLFVDVRTADTLQDFVEIACLRSLFQLEQRIVNVEGFDLMVLEIHEVDVLEHGVEIAQVVVELAPLQIRGALRDVLQLGVDEHMLVHLTDDAQADVDVVPVLDVAERFGPAALA